MNVTNGSKLRCHQHRFSQNVIRVRRLLCSIFVRKTACQKYFFQKNAHIVNLKNPDLDLIRRIHPECGFYGFMIRFWIRISGFGFSPKNAPSVISRKCTLRIALKRGLLLTRPERVTSYNWGLPLSCKQVLSVPRKQNRASDLNRPRSSGVGKLLPCLKWEICLEVHSFSVNVHFQNWACRLNFKVALLYLYAVGYVFESRFSAGTI